MKLIGFTFPPISAHRESLPRNGLHEEEKVASKQNQINQAYLFRGVCDKGLSEMLVRQEPKLLSDGRTNVWLISPQQCTAIPP